MHSRSLLRDEPALDSLKCTTNAVEYSRFLDYSHFHTVQDMLQTGQTADKAVMVRGLDPAQVSLGPEQESNLLCSSRPDTSQRHPLPKRTCLGALALSKTKHTGVVIF